MEPEQIKKILRKKIKELGGLSLHIGDGFYTTTIHDFRVAFKTLRSFLRLLNMDDKNALLKIPEKIRRLYDISGAIRDSQLELKKITDEQLAFPVYTDHLCQNIKRKKMEWQQHYSGKIFHDFSVKLSEKELKPLHPSLLQDFVNMKIAAIRDLYNLRSPTDDQVHSIRKLVKDMLYTAKLAEKKWGAGYREIKTLQTAPLEQIADTIGEYNDGRIMLDHLCAFRSDAMGVEEQSSMENFCSEEKKRLKKMKKETLAAVRKYINKERAYIDS